MTSPGTANNKKGLLALSPLAVFLLIYLGSSIFADDFYSVPVSAAFLLACIYAVGVSGGTVRERVKAFSAGAGNVNILMMVWIFILAGAFAGTASAMGAVDSIVNMALSVMPPSMLLAGMFLISCFISMSIGTSVGTVVALVPIATGIAAECGLSTSYMAAVVLGGAFFGDNLSFISDTTIAATKSMGIEMKEKFHANIRIVLPAMIAVTVIYLVKGLSVQAAAGNGDFELVKVLPYLLVIVMALIGFNAVMLLSIGIVLNLLVGIICGDMTLIGWLSSIGTGVSGMNELIVVTLLAGGMMSLVRKNGGIDYAIGKLSSNTGGKKGAQFSIAALVCIANLCTANNTIAIITVGDISREISARFGVDPRKAASILDTISCLTQGVIPYGAQILMASTLAGCQPVEILPYLYYPFLMGVCAILAIVFGLPRKYA